MAKKTSKKKTTKVEPVTPDLPVNISEVRNLAIGLRNMPDVPENMDGQRNKVAASIDRLADRMEKAHTASIKATEKEAKKAEREAKKAEKDAAKKAKKEAQVKALREKLAKMEADLAD